MDGIVWGDKIAPVNLIMHLVFGVLLMGASTHHLVQLVKGRGFKPQRVVQRYAYWTCVGYLVTFFWGVVIYPAYSYHVRYLYSDVNTPWATALFEIKEHILAVGLGVLPLYYRCSSNVGSLMPRQRILYMLCIWTLAFIVWYSFIIDAILVNLKGI